MGVIGALSIPVALLALSAGWGLNPANAAGSKNGAGSQNGAGSPDGDETERAERWKELQHALFGDRQIQDGSAWLGIDAPARALDAALVPISLTVKGDRAIKGIYLVIDNNPGPLAGHFIFGPQGDPHSLKLRVRVNAYTYVHAVAETRDNQLFSAARFVKAAGGCSAPAGAREQQALQDIGHSKVRLMQPFAAGKPLGAEPIIRQSHFKRKHSKKGPPPLNPPPFPLPHQLRFQHPPRTPLD